MPRDPVKQGTAESRIKKPMTKVTRDTAPGVVETTYWVIPRPSKADCYGVASTAEKKQRG